MTDYAEKKESVVFCEGFHDRDFWAGWLERRLGWADPGVRGGKRVAFNDPFGRSVTKGHFGFAKERRFVRVQQCEGAEKVIAEALRRLGQRTDQALHHVVINLDSDATDGGPGPAERRLADLRAQLRAMNGGNDPEVGPSPNSFRLDGVLVSTVVWRVDEPEAPGVPTKQTLERVVAASLAAADRERATAVDAWLRAAPNAAVDGQGAILGKAYTWSHMAKWHPSLGRDGFYRHIWTIPAVAEQLDERLRASGARAIADAL